MEEYAGYKRSESWYALQVKPRHERVVAELLSQKGIPSMAPVYASRRNWSDRVRVISLPLFPGYIFAEFDAQYCAPVITTPGLVRIVGMGKRPVPVEPDEIDSLRRALAAGIECQPHAGLQAGDQVEVISGPMRGTRGVLSRVRGQNRFLISVSLLNRSVSLEVDESQLIKRSVLSVRKTA